MQSQRKIALTFMLASKCRSAPIVEAMATPYCKGGLGNTHEKCGYAMKAESYEWKQRSNPH